MKHKKLKKRTDLIQQVKYGLPREAFAIVTDLYASETWLLPHHTPKGDIDWSFMALCVAGLSRYHENRVQATPEMVLEAAKHLAEHYQEAKRPIPDTLAVLI
jgi:hypothetical protein